MAIIFSMLAGLALAAVILYVWINHVIVFTQAFGPSMTPAVWDGDYVMLVRVSRWHKFRVGGLYVFYPPYYKYGEGTVLKRLTKIMPDGKLFFEGDNKNNSYDSRKYGPVSPDAVKFRVNAVFRSTARDKKFEYVKNAASGEKKIKM